MGETQSFIIILKAIPKSIWENLNKRLTRLERGLLLVCNAGSIQFFLWDEAWRFDFLITLASLVSKTKTMRRIQHEIPTVSATFKQSIKRGSNRSAHDSNEIAQLYT